jgi:pyrimidine-nucleoside phosphorylase
MNCLPLIEAKREGQALTPAQITELVSAFTARQIPDYQMAALLMAIYFRGLNPAETRALTLSMRDSGEVLAFPNDCRPVVDKHSTGGVGDKVSLPLAPLLACLGFRVPMISGRGLGITGGTLDKLESIPGFRTSLTVEQIISQVQTLGVAMVGQTDRMIPADKQLYALRDVTGTVPSIPLITASILSKKLAEGIQALVMDVKFGPAAFMPTLAQARQLAQSIVRLATECGVNTRAFITNMERPLGRAAGNWLEVVEAVDCLNNRGPADLRALVIDCAASLLLQTGLARDEIAAKRTCEDCLASREPLRKWEELIQAQGANLDHYHAALESYPGQAPCLEELRSATAGYIGSVDARSVGEVVRNLGGGRFTKDSPIHPGVGLDQMVQVKEKVEAGMTLCRVHAVTREAARAAVERLRTAFVVVPDEPEISPLVQEVCV